MERKNPWPGLASYDEKNGLFCGRTQSVNDVFSLICNNQAVTLYGRSGIGKTSLIKAGVAPLLRRRGYLPVYVRLMREIIPGEDGPFSLCIVRRLQALLPASCQPADAGVPATDPAFLWEWFLANSFQNGEGEQITPVLILDQFEEIFFYKEEEVRLFLRQISLLLDDSRRLPDEYDPEAFRSRIRFVFSFRDDALYKMEEAADRDNLAALKQNRYVLKALSREQAAEVILLPSEDIQSGSRMVTQRVADSILDKLERDRNDVDPAILSLLMSELYDKMVSTGSGEITEDLVSDFGGDIIRGYYLKGVSHVSSRTVSFLERELVTADGRRRSVASGDMRGFIRQDDIKSLLDRHILSEVVKGDVVDYELSHDVLCPIVQQNRRRRRGKRRVLRAVSAVILSCLLLLGGFWAWNWSDKTEQARRAYLRSVEQSRDAASAAVLALQDSLEGLTGQYRRERVKAVCDSLMEGFLEPFRALYAQGDASYKAELEAELAAFDDIIITRPYRVYISEDGRYFCICNSSGRYGVKYSVTGKPSFREGNHYDPERDSLVQWTTAGDIRSLAYEIPGENTVVNAHFEPTAKENGLPTWKLFLFIRRTGKDHQDLSTGVVRKLLSAGYFE